MCESGESVYKAMSCFNQCPPELLRWTHPVLGFGAVHCKFRDFIIKILKICSFVSIDSG